MILLQLYWYFILFGVIKSNKAKVCVGDRGGGVGGKSKAVHLANLSGDNSALKQSTERKYT